MSSSNLHDLPALAAVQPGRAEPAHSRHGAPLAGHSGRLVNDAV